jgi:hypothetical protein
MYESLGKLLLRYLLPSLWIRPWLVVGSAVRVRVRARARARARARTRGS